MSDNQTSEYSPLELYGRMYECIDIERGIESGQFKTLDDVLNAVNSRITFINSKLKNRMPKPSKPNMHTQKAGDPLQEVPANPYTLERMKAPNKANSEPRGNK